jgi:hypothetical protein
VLAAVSRCYPELQGRFPRVTHPSAAGGRNPPLDLHVLSAPPAFVLSQDQTLSFIPASTRSRPLSTSRTQTGSRSLKSGSRLLRSQSQIETHSRDARQQRARRRLHIPSIQNLQCHRSAQRRQRNRARPCSPTPELRRSWDRHRNRRRRPYIDFPTKPIKRLFRAKPTNHQHAALSEYLRRSRRPGTLRPRHRRARTARRHATA